MKNLNTNEKIAVVVGILIVGFFFIFGGTVMNIIRIGTLTPSASTASTTSTTSSQVVIQDVIVGAGDVATPGSKVTVNYTGTFTNGTKFDSSYDRNQPFTFTLGAKQVIAGWDQGIIGMKVGGKRVLIVPPELGYGSADYGPIPGNSTLVFQVELVSVQK